MLSTSIEITDEVIQAIVSTVIACATSEYKQFHFEVKFQAKISNDGVLKVKDIETINLFDMKVNNEIH